MLTCFKIFSTVFYCYPKYQLVIKMPLPAALAARLAKRGILSKENQPPVDEEVIAEDYDKTDERLDEFGNHLPPNWDKVWEPERDTWYYWDTLTDQVTWLPPNDPEAVITWPASKNIDIPLPSVPEPTEPKRNKNLNVKFQKSSYEKKKTRVREEFDPMDPSSYSDAPVGDWSSGLKKIDDAKTGVDSTANGPLFQQRPYPSPGEVLSRNKQAHRDFGPMKPK